MRDNDENDLAIALGKLLTSDVSPEEAEFYDELVASNDTTKKQLDHPLGFGVPVELQSASIILLAVAQFLIPVLVNALKGAASNIIGQAGQELEKSISERLSKWIKSAFRDRAELNITLEQRSAIIDRAVIIAEEKGLPKDKCGLLRLRLQESLD